MKRSPGGPPLGPLPPCPVSRIRVPVSTPDGTVIMTVFRTRFSPVPLHSGHRSEGICFRPRHMGQGRLTAKPPCPKVTVPRPLHSGHVFIVAPGAAPEPWHTGHSSFTSSCTGTLPPSAATRNGIDSVVSIDCPRSGPACRPRGPAAPPNIELKRSPSPPRPPMSKSSKRKPPVEPAPPGAPVPGRAPPNPPPRRVKSPNAPSRRISSYCFRFSASPRTLYASEISLNFSAALGSLRFASGCHFLARRRYCFLISSCEADAETPR